MKKRFAAITEGACKVCGEWSHCDDDGVCNDHPRKTITGDFLLCRHCAWLVPQICHECDMEKDYLDSDGRCVQCAHGGGWLEDHNRAMRTGTCSSCGNRGRALSAEGICKRCFIENSLKNARLYESAITQCEDCGEYIRAGETHCSHCKSKQRDCIDCGRKFIPYEKKQYLCLTCLPVCAGCDHAFVPNTRTEVLCAECFTRASQGKCVKCGERQPLNHHGKCISCAPNTPVHLCQKCHDVQVPIPGMICEECASEEDICPMCKKNKIRADQYVCNTCLKPT